MIRPMKKIFLESEIFQNIGMIYTIIRVIVQMENKLKNYQKKMNYRNLWKKVKIHNGGEILQMI